MVRKQKLSKVVGGNKWGINNNLDEECKPRSPDSILREANSQVGKMMEYSLIRNNCEHFATKLRYGQAVSNQVGWPILFYFFFFFYKHDCCCSFVEKHRRVSNVRQDVTSCFWKCNFLFFKTLYFPELWMILKDFRLSRKLCTSSKFKMSVAHQNVHCCQYMIRQKCLWQSKWANYISDMSCNVPHTLYCKRTSMNSVSWWLNHFNTSVFVFWHVPTDMGGIWLIVIILQLPNKSDTDKSTDTENLGGYRAILQDFFYYSNYF